LNDSDKVLVRCLRRRKNGPIFGSEYTKNRPLISPTKRERLNQTLRQREVRIFDEPFTLRVIGEAVIDPVLGESEDFCALAMRHGRRPATHAAPQLSGIEALARGVAHV
jgi:hypothetical protein